MTHLPPIVPMPLQRYSEPFDHPDWLFELKYDGFRALACLRDGKCNLISRNGHVFKSFEPLAYALAASLGQVQEAVIDGEIVCLDGNGKPQFNNLLFRRGEACFVAFDLPHCGEDLQFLPLIERTRKLKSLLRSCSGPILYADHIEGSGVALFERACELDLEGIVAKHKYGPYTSERDASTWFKIKNRRYSQTIGREELFERDRHREPVPGWHSCELTCASVND